MAVCSLNSCDALAQPEHSPCCSSSFHRGKSLCCKHYGIAHFCVGACSPDRHPSTSTQPDVDEDLDDEGDPGPCCPDPQCTGSPCTFPGYADNH